MAELSNDGKKLLKLLADLLPNVKADNPGTYISYKKVHEKLGLQLHGETHGTSLQRQGLNDLAEWTMAEGHPAITGLIIDQLTYTPGKGYFDLLGSPQNDFSNWEKHIKLSKKYNWQPFLETELSLKTALIASDKNTPSDRITYETTRIIRDTNLAKNVKKRYNFKCQICSHSIKLPKNKCYAEAHHIKPLGMPHNGPDTEDNIICLCPNHHAAVDFGAIEICKSKLTIDDGHEINSEFIDYHNKNIFQT